MEEWVIELVEKLNSDVDVRDTLVPKLIWLALAEDHVEEHSEVVCNQINQLRFILLFDCLNRSKRFIYQSFEIHTCIFKSPKCEALNPIFKSLQILLPQFPLNIIFLKNHLPKPQILTNRHRLPTPHRVLGCNFRDYFLKKLFSYLLEIISELKHFLLSFSCLFGYWASDVKIKVC